MRTVTSAELKKLALSKGATVVIGGETFNAEKETVSSGKHGLRKPRSEPVAPIAPIVTKTPEPAPAIEIPQPIINIDMSKFAEDNTAALKTITDAIKSQKPAATVRPTEWEIDLKRDGNNLIQSFTIKAK